MAAPAAPEAPALAYLVLGLLAFVAWITLRGCRGIWSYSFGAILGWIGDHLRIHTFGFTLDLGRPARELNTTVLNNLNTAATALEGAVGYFFHGSAVLFQWAVNETLTFAEETLGFSRWLLHVHLPRWLKWSLAVLFPPALIYRIVRAALHAYSPHVAKVAAGAVTDVRAAIGAQLRPIRRALGREAKAIAGLSAVVAAIAGGLAWPHPGHVAIPWPRLKVLERWRTKVDRRLSRMEKALGATGFALLMANVLGLRSARCLRSGAVGRVARALCGLGAQALEDLLALLVDVFIVTDLCEVMSLLDDAIPYVIGPVDAIIDGFDTLGGKCEWTYPATLNVAPLFLPPASALALTAG